MFEAVRNLCHNNAEIPDEAVTKCGLSTEALDFLNVLRDGPFSVIFMEIAEHGISVNDICSHCEISSFYRVFYFYTRYVLSI